MAPHSSTLAWKIPRTEEPGGPQSMGSLRVGHDWATSLSLFTFLHWRRKWQPTPVFLPGESQGWGSLVGCRLWVAQSWTRLKRLSSSSSNAFCKMSTTNSLLSWEWLLCACEFLEVCFVFFCLFVVLCFWSDAQCSVSAVFLCSRVALSSDFSLENQPVK